jgi:hypothetical protein
LLAHSRPVVLLASVTLVTVVSSSAGIVSTLGLDIGDLVFQRRQEIEADRHRKQWRLDERFLALPSIIHGSDVISTSPVHQANTE